MNKDLVIYLCGFYALGFAIFHMAFWRVFHWKTALQKLNPTNRAIMQIFNLRLIYFFLLTAFFCFFFTTDLYTTPFGNAYLVGISLFCLGRLIEQFIFLRINHRLVHLLSVLFFLGTVLFLLPLF